VRQKETKKMENGKNIGQKTFDITDQWHVL
jgi:hypothetical protein